MYSATFMMRSCVDTVRPERTGDTVTAVEVARECFLLDLFMPSLCQASLPPINIPMTLSIIRTTTHHPVSHNNPNDQEHIHTY